ncbi:MAG: HAD-IC family P-type ATPase [Acutalibacteraceae bacterium]
MEAHQYEKKENTSEIKGLTSQQVQERISEGKVNTDTTVKTKSVKRIFYDNIFTLFNGVNIILLIMVILSGSYKNALFMGVVISNTAIGIFQEIRSKKSVDKLSILVSKKAVVLRDGKEQEIPIEDIVLDDVIKLKRGDQIPSDSVIISGCVSVNESLLTGESDLIDKNKGDKLMSGSFISAGNCIARVCSVGADNYISKIHASAKYIKKVNSEIMNTLNKIIKICSFIIFPIGAVLFTRQYFVDYNFSKAIVATVAGMLGMIPEGLILLTSTVLAVSVIRLSKNKVLVQELFCIESLARVDVLCLDKTGTITCDMMNVENVIPFKENKSDEISIAIKSLAYSSTDENATVNALRDYVDNSGALKPVSVIPFSSEKKWSGASFENGASYIMGAAEFVLKEKFSQVSEIISEYEKEYRVLTIAKSSQVLQNAEIPSDIEPVAFVLIKDKIREEAPQTIKYFIEQGVTLKVISGDNVKTVANIAKSAGIKNAEMVVDATTLKTDEEIYEAAEKFNVFGRVTPHQKEKLIKALKSHGHTVAMTGDGVNDVLALKEADCSVAMAAGSEAARNVAHIVLIDNNFSSMPKVVAEGRRTINNIQRSASLFLVKTIYSVLLSVLFMIIGYRYPFEPVQMSLISAMTIGLPSFALALEPNHDRVTGNFFYNIISKAFPAAITIVLNIVAVTLCRYFFNYSDVVSSTMCVILTAVIGVLFIIRLSIPFNAYRTALLSIVCAGLALGMFFFSDLFSLCFLNFSQTIVLLVLALIAIILFLTFYRLFDSYFDKRLLNLQNKN